MANAIKKLGQSISSYGKSMPDSLVNATSDLLASSDFISRTIGMNNSYEDIMFIVQSLGREPISLLGKDYLFIFDHVRRNYNQGTNVINHNYDIPKFTFYKERPTVKFANPEEDNRNFLGHWEPEFELESTSSRNILKSYAESPKDGVASSIEIPTSYDIDDANPGINFGGISSFANTMSTSDMLRKTNMNFHNGKYKTLVARFHTDSMDSKARDNITQTALTEKYGMSHGRNLLKTKETVENGYENPYCRVWTYHHQYNQMARAIRPFEVESQLDLEKEELRGQVKYDTVGFKTKENKEYGFKGGSERLDTYGVLNYRNGLVNIAPTAKIKDYFEHKESEQVTIKKCMFSLENLAWKENNIIQDQYDQMGLSPEQKGPLGGRIMWFPPYDLSFSEDVRVNWNQNQFIGRGESVYTYTNTERSGNLSFTLLIDHPSILDYWTGHKRNGMKNKGKTLLPGNGGGVDEIYNQENTLLRFFAGCDILSAKPQEFKLRTNEPPKDTKDPPVPVTPVINNPPPTEVHKQGPIRKKFCCVLYYPNNYSGADDAPIKDSNSANVNAIYYLMTGVGTQKYYDPTTKKTTDINTLDIMGNATVNGTTYNGYELGEHGVSITTEVLNTNAINSTFVEGSTDNSQYLTDASGSKYTATYGSNSYDLVKIIGNCQNVSAQEKKCRGGCQSAAGKQRAYTKSWLHRRYYYRVDKDFETQVFNHFDSYIDTKSYKLNGSGYYQVLENAKLCEKIGFDPEDTEQWMCSFAELFMALEGDKGKAVLPEGSYDENVATIIKDLANTEEVSIVSAKIVGLASKQGRLCSNERLAKNRAATFKNWLASKNFLPGVTISATSDVYDSKDRVDVGGDNELTSKEWRCAALVIEYDFTKIEDAATAEPVRENVDKVSTNGTGGLHGVINNWLTNTPEGQTVVQKAIDATTVPAITFPEKKSSEKPYLTVKDWLEHSEEGQKVMEEHGQFKQVILPNGQIKYEREIDPWTATFQDISKFTGKNYIDRYAWDDYDDSFLKLGITVSEPKVVERYDNEGEFFELLEKNDPFMHQLITDKIKYFDPAFHSVSPEGFNARLTFLHQCTRQGSTVGSDERSTGTAYNLAFGRPPVCVLRLGDFFYTKIIINSMSIQYETPQWDLNPEGIGVMPMFAKVTLSFIFLGGSDLAGPISRLQNAVSFNYYANTGVYDNRAEMVQYDPNGSGREIKFKPYSYPDMIRDNRKKLVSTIDVSK